MSQTVIFSVGFVVFALTVWGAIMAGGIWFGQLAEADDNRSDPWPTFTERGPSEIGDTPRTTTMTQCLPFTIHE
jgi:hypothetical protein